LINTINIKSPYLHQCKHGSKAMASSTFITTSSNLQIPNHPGYLCQHSPPDLMKPTSNHSHYKFLALGWMLLNWWSVT